MVKYDKCNEMLMVALAKDDGWAIVKIDGNLYMLRPPYSEHVELTENDIAKAIRRHGFEACNEEFDTLDDVIKFLKDVYVEAMEKRGIKCPTHEELKQHLRYISEDMLLRWIARIESDSIPCGEFDKASLIIKDIIEMTVSDAARTEASRVLEIIRSHNENTKH